MSTPRDRFLAALRGEAQDAPTGWMMRQAGRYLPEYQATRKGKTFLDTTGDPTTATEITLQPIRRYGMDTAVVFSDILIPPQAMGLHLEFHEGRGPVLSPPVRTREDVDRLRDFVPEQDTTSLLETLRRVRAELGNERALVGFCGAPFTTVSYMVEGGTSRNFENSKRILFDDPDLFSALTDKLTENLVPYLKAQVAAGADALQIFDSWGGALDAETYRKHLLPSLKRLVAEAKSTGAPVLVYANGGSHLIEVLLDAEPDALSIDWRTDVARARELCAARGVALQGNLDPTILFASPDVVRRETARVLDAFRGHPGYVFNLGSGILPKTPTDSVGAAFETLFARRG